MDIVLALWWLLLANLVPRTFLRRLFVNVCPISRLFDSTFLILHICSNIKPPNKNVSNLDKVLSFEQCFSFSESCRTIPVEVNKSFGCQLKIFKFPSRFQWTLQEERATFTQYALSKIHKKKGFIWKTKSRFKLMLIDYRILFIKVFVNVYYKLFFHWFFLMSKQLRRIEFAKHWACSFNP